MPQLPQLQERPGSRLSRGSFNCLLVALVLVAGCVGAVRIDPGLLSSGSEQTAIPPRFSVPPTAPPATTAPVAPSSSQAEIEKLISLGKPLFCGGTTKPYVALTFDDGPGPYTAQALSILRSYGAGASFFLVGKLAAAPSYAGVVKQETSYATIGDHTWDHVPITGEPPAFLRAQVIRTRTKLQQLSGTQIYFFRPPDGYFNSYTDRWLSSHNMIQTLWSVDSRDSDGANASQILANISREVGPGSIIELHENRATTLADLPQIIQLLQAKGLIPVSLNQLLTLDPPTTKQVMTGTC